MIDFNHNYRMTIGGRLETSANSFKAFNPATKQEIAEVPDATRAQLDEAVAAARAAFPQWRAAPREQRQHALVRIAELLEKHAEEFMTGNCIIVKPSPFTPLCTLKLGELCREILPAGVLNVVSGGDELGKWMSSHAGIDKIAFTGHTETGKHVMRSAAGSLKRVTLELGGNDPAIVLPDVDPEAVAPQLFWAAFQNNAQFCNATKRLYVHDEIYDAVLAALTAYAKTVVVGDGARADTQLGPIQNEPQYLKVLEYIEDCKRNGYRFALGGEVDSSAQGWFVPVTLVDDPPEDSRVVAEEPFGPILPTLRWRDESDVIRRANDTRYGLGASVWGRDLNAVQRIGRQLEAGTVWLNEVHQYSPHQAFGGHKESGVGCENSLHGMMEYTNWHTITLNKTAMMR
jgi:acyl-CoA reductase-like NAD-dependent aldehyde dehydrogenase